MSAHDDRRDAPARNPRQYAIWFDFPPIRLSLADSAFRRDELRIPIVWAALLLSLLLHLAILWQWRLPILPPSPGDQTKGATTGQLSARIAPRPGPAPPAARATAPAAAPEPAPQSRAAPPKPAPPMRAPAPALAERSPRPLPVPAPAPPQRQAEQQAEQPDMAAQVEARQRARVGVAPAAPGPQVSESQPIAGEDENARRDRNIAANLGSLRAPAPGENSRRGGGVFQIRRIGYEDAEFMFFGWNKDMGRNNTQLVEVRKGDNPDMRIAVVRRMIAIVREHEKGDFLWDSRRAARTVQLSARIEDTAKLEAFLLKEFF